MNYQVGRPKDTPAALARLNALRERNSNGQPGDPRAPDEPEKQYVERTSRLQNAMERPSALDIARRATRSPVSLVRSKEDALDATVETAAKRAQSVSEPTPSETVHPPHNVVKRGFATMSPERLKEIASLGGRAAHASGNAHQFTPDEAREASRKSRTGTSETSKEPAYSREAYIGRREAAKRQHIEDILREIAAYKPL